LSAEVAGHPQTWRGRIVRGEAELDSSSGQLFLVAQVEQPDNSRDGAAPLLSGLFVQAEIEGVARAGLYALPRNALNNLGQVKLVDAEQRLTFRDVELLRGEPGRVIVKSGLNAGERIVVSDMPMPVAGMRVEVSAERP